MVVLLDIRGVFMVVVVTVLVAVAIISAMGIALVAMSAKVITGVKARAAGGSGAGVKSRKCKNRVRAGCYRLIDDPQSDRTQTNLR